MTYAGSPSPRMLFIGEAWGRTEDELSRPFVGGAGMLLWQMIGEAGIGDGEAHGEVSKLLRQGRATWADARDEWLEANGLALTNVFEFRPTNNDLSTLCCDKKELSNVVGHAIPGPPGCCYPWPAIGRSAGTGPQIFLRPEWLSSCTRLANEIASARPNLCCLLGNTASWAMLQKPSISAIRGTVGRGVCIGDTAGRRNSGSGGSTFVKCLPTFHPAGVMRNWSWRTIVLADLIKAWRESATVEFNRPARRIVINPELIDIKAFLDQLLLTPTEQIAVDIETAGGMITCIGFATGPENAIVIPFRKKDWGNYWKTQEDEVQAWKYVQIVLNLPCPKVFQNGMYELQWFAENGLSVNGDLHDTMLMHHAIFPEMQKGLGFLGSIYTNEPAWKLLRLRKKDEMEKADE